MMMPMKESTKMSREKQRAFIPQNVTEQMQYTHMKEAQERALKGPKAVAAVEELIGRELTANERKIVIAEGYTPDYYLDSKDIITRGVGQTKEYMDQDFDQVMEAKDKELRAYVDDYSTLNPRLQDALFSNNYRGSLAQSPRTRKLINDKEYSAAAVEFLKNDEYLNENTSQGIKNRFEETAAALREQAGESTWMDGINSLGRQVKSKFKDTFRPAVRAVEGVVDDFSEGAVNMYDAATDAATDIFGGVEQPASFDEISPTRFAGHIAYENGMSLDELQALNPEVEITRGSMGRALQAGQKLRVGSGWYENMA
jgi:GH24 family phage-related lysozyme (muramidase)